MKAKKNCCRLLIIFFAAMMLFLSDLSCNKAEDKDEGGSAAVVDSSIIATYDTPGLAFDVYVSGSYAYVADGDSGIQIINISNIGVPAKVGTYKNVKGSGLHNSLFVLCLIARKIKTKKL